MANKRQYKKTYSGYDSVFADGLEVSGPTELNGNAVINGDLTVNGIVITPGGLATTDSSFVATNATEQLKW